MICVIRPSDCSTSVGIILAEEATGICAKVLAGKPASIVSKATQAIKRGKLEDIKIVVLLEGICEPRATLSHKRQHSFYCAVSDGSSMVWIQQDSRKRSQNHTGGYHTVFLGVNETPTMKHTLKQ